MDYLKLLFLSNIVLSLGAVGEADIFTVDNRTSKKFILGIPVEALTPERLFASQATGKTETNQETLIRYLDILPNKTLSLNIDILQKFNKVGELCDEEKKHCIPVFPKKYNQLIIEENNGKITIRSLNTATGRSIQLAAFNI